MVEELYLYGSRFRRIEQILRLSAPQQQQQPQQPAQPSPCRCHPTDIRFTEIRLPYDPRAKEYIQISTCLDDSYNYHAYVFYADQPSYYGPASLDHCVVDADTLQIKCTPVLRNIPYAALGYNTSAVYQCQSLGGDVYMAFYARDSQRRDAIYLIKNNELLGMITSSDLNASGLFPDFGVRQLMVDYTGTVYLPVSTDTRRLVLAISLSDLSIKNMCDITGLGMYFFVRSEQIEPYSGIIYIALMEQYVARAHIYELHRDCMHYYLYRLMEVYSDMYPPMSMHVKRYDALRKVHVHEVQFSTNYGGADYIIDPPYVYRLYSDRIEVEYMDFMLRSMAYAYFTPIYGPGLQPYIILERLHQYYIRRETIQFDPARRRVWFGHAVAPNLAVGNQRWNVLVAADIITQC